jgi:hypothetical protein
VKAVKEGVEKELGDEGAPVRIPDPEHVQGDVEGPSDAVTEKHCAEIATSSGPIWLEKWSYPRVRAWHGRSRNTV